MSKVFAAGILGGLVWFVFLARKESGDVWQRLGMYLYKKACMVPGLRNIFQKEERQVVKNLIGLHPGGAPAELLTAHYVEKIRLMSLVLFVGSFIVLCVGIPRDTFHVAVENGKVHRGKETETILLEAQVQEGGSVKRETIPLEVEARVLRKNEADVLYEQFAAELEILMLGNNPSLQEVGEDLYLPEEMEGYPFWINWSSTAPSFLGSDGRVQTETLESIREVILRAEIQYEEWEWQRSWQVILLPPVRTEEEQWLFDLKKYTTEAAEKNRNEADFSLPETVNGRAVKWKKKTEDTGWFLLVLTLLSAVAVYGLKDKDIQSDLEKRKACMREAYPEMVSKYALFLGAGMTVRGSFQKICRDYYEKYEEEEGVRGRKKPIHPLYEELLYACNELRAGVSESKVYENFGLRTGVTEYTRLCTLLSQNLKKGNAALVQRLWAEYEEAIQEGCRIRKKRGEEAGTRLLLPMVMMLLMVLLMIMLPAFAGLGG